jgi:hypothetical protein
MFLQVIINPPAAPDSLWKILLPSFIGTATALTVFYLAYWREIKKENAKERRERINKIKYLQNLLHEVDKYLNGQLEHINVFANRIESNLMEFHILTFVPLNQHKRLLEALNNEDYFHAFNEYYLKVNPDFNTVNAFNRLIGNVGYQLEALEELKSVLKNGQTNDYELKIAFKNHVDLIIKEVGDLLILIRALPNRSSNTNALYSELATIDNTFASQLANVSDIKSYFNDLVKPIHASIQYHIGIGSVYLNNLVTISRYCVEAMRDFEMILNGNKAFLTDINNTKESLTVSNKK